MSSPTPSPQTDLTDEYKKEIINSASHGIGVIASIIGLVFLILSDYSGIELTGLIVYGSSLILLFLASTLYHGITHHKLKQTFQILDHCAIYLLIAGSYTPLLLITVEPTLGNMVLWCVWGLAVIGIFFKLIFGERFEKASLISYLCMGWLCLLIIYELWEKLSTGGFTLLVAGGLTYTVGTFFYSNDRIPYNHAIWHLFVLGGAGCHYFMVLFYLTPVAI